VTRTIGIDLGTTYSAVATAHNGVAEILPNREGDRLTPSVVVFDNGQPLVGKEARTLSTAMPEDYVEFVKRKMGDAGAQYIDEDGTEYGPEQISALLLRRLADDGELLIRLLQGKCRQRQGQGGHHGKDECESAAHNLPP
jgi:molecular chaperone DnaK